MKVKVKTTQKIKNIARNFISQNYKEYLLVLIIFIIGILIGVIILNNSSEDKLNSITSYINDFINSFKQTEKINISELIINSIKNNMFLTIIIWLAGTTVIGMPIVLGMIGINGVSLGFTLACITYSFGIGKGILFNMAALLIQNIFFIPAMLTLGVSSIKLYKSILKDRRKENIKIEIIRHTIISIIMFLLLIVSAIMQNIVSLFFIKKITNILW